MAFPKNVWNQIKNLRKDDVVEALKRDGYEKDPASRDATITYLKPLSSPDETGSKHKRIVIHYHPGQICGPKLIRDIIEDAGWSVDDLRRLKLVK